MSTEYINAYAKLLWQCEEGHIWEASTTSVRHGEHWCPVCAKEEIKARPRTTIKDLKKIAQKRKGECLIYDYAAGKIQWRCKQGHTWEASASAAKNAWCSICRKGKKLFSLEDMRQFAKEQNGECLSAKYENVRSRLKWRCSSGHIWETTPNSIIYGKTWCPKCPKKVRRPKHQFGIEDIKVLAKQQGIDCISNEYINAFTKLQWQCSFGHTWEATPFNLKRENCIA